MMKVGQLVQPWTKDTCQCGSDYYVTRSYARVVWGDDFYCSSCLDAFKLDLQTKRVKDLEVMLGSMIDVAEELNYRLRKPDQSKGFYGKIELAKELIKEK